MEESGAICMFMGQFNHSLDEKKRVIIPSKFREKLGHSFIITKGFDGCLAVYTEAEWIKLQERLLSMNSNQADTRRHIRILVGSATQCECDKQGRVSLPSNLITASGITKEVVLVGNINHIEIWSLENWQKYYDEANESFDEIAEKLVA